VCPSPQSIAAHAGAVIAVDERSVSTMRERIRAAEFTQRPDSMSFACNLKHQPPAQRYGANDVVVTRSLAVPF
jgi:hypothetical protein